MCGLIYTLDNMKSSYTHIMLYNACFILSRVLSIHILVYTTQSQLNVLLIFTIPKLCCYTAKYSFQPSLVLFIKTPVI